MSYFECYQVLNSTVLGQQRLANFDILRAFEKQVQHWNYNESNMNVMDEQFSYLTVWITENSKILSYYDVIANERYMSLIVCSSSQHTGSSLKVQLIAWEVAWKMFVCLYMDLIVCIIEINIIG